MKQHNPMKYIHHLVPQDPRCQRPTHGWQVRAKRVVRRNGRDHTLQDINRFFAFRKYGGKYAALARAVRWRERNVPREWLT